MCYNSHNATTFSKLFPVSYKVMQIMAYSHHHQKGESVLKAEFQTRKEVRNYLNYVTYGCKGTILH